MLNGKKTKTIKNDSAVSNPDYDKQWQYSTEETICLNVNTNKFPIEITRSKRRPEAAREL